MRYVRPNWRDPAFAETLRRAQGNRCPLCGSIFGPLPTSFEHVVPRSRGGKHASNLLLTHHRCNQRRGNAPATGCLMIWLAAVNARLEA